jgi:hypothetical protein
VSSEGRGFDSIEFIRRYGSQSVLCRKAKSAENIPSSNQNVSLKFEALYNITKREFDFQILVIFFFIFQCLQRRFSENPTSHKNWESEEPQQTDNVEVVECHLEPTSFKNNLIKTPKKLLAALPTLSISGPSPAPSRNQSPEASLEEEEETQNFL